MKLSHLTVIREDDIDDLTSAASGIALDWHKLLIELQHQEEHAPNDFIIGRMKIDPDDEEVCTFQAVHDFPDHIQHDGDVQRTMRNHPALVLDVKVMIEQVQHRVYVYVKAPRHPAFKDTKIVGLSKAAHNEAWLAKQIHLTINEVVEDYKGESDFYD